MAGKKLFDNFKLDHLIKDEKIILTLESRHPITRNICFLDFYLPGKQVMAIIWIPGVRFTNLKTMLS